MKHFVFKNKVELVNGSVGKGVCYQALMMAWSLEPTRWEENGFLEVSSRLCVYTLIVILHHIKTN